MSSFMHAHRPARSSGRTSPGDARWLPVTQRGDALERGADVLADRAARASAASTARRPLLRPSQGWGVDHAGGAGVVPPGGGRPLEPAVRAGMESSFGWDFSRVRLHRGDEASSMAQRMQARAYAVGHDIVLGGGEMIVGAAGRRLLAHELAHVVQYDLSGRAVLAREPSPGGAPVAPVKALEPLEVVAQRIARLATGPSSSAVAKIKNIGGPEQGRVCDPQYENGSDICWP